MRFHKTTVAAVLAASVTLAGVAQGAEDNTVTIGFGAWSSNEMTTKIARQVLEQHLGVEVELMQLQMASLYQSLKKGDVDVMLTSWQPETHADYIDKVGDSTVNLGILFSRAKLGWVVPDYVPKDKLNSITDLKEPETREKLDGQIVGIDPGAGLTRLSKKAMKEYGLADYNLQISSGAGMTAALKRAVARNEWIVVTGWSPHWKFGAWDLRYIEDPKTVLGEAERVHALARQGFYQDNIAAAMTLARMWIPLEDLQTYMYEARQSSYEEAAADYIADNPERIDYWVNGGMPQTQ